ncbi:MAG: hypothetical protein Q8N94_05455 [Methanoregula sp.]|nr:hypothetical protein [Methanoregula sp.]
MSVKSPCLYRIRPINKDFLMYIGETRRTVHQRVNELRHTIKRTDLMPWNSSPHGRPLALGLVGRSGDKKTIEESEPMRLLACNIPIPSSQKKFAKGI